MLYVYRKQLLITLMIVICVVAGIIAYTYYSDKQNTNHATQTKDSQQVPIDSDKLTLDTKTKATLSSNLENYTSYPVDAFAAKIDTYKKTINGAIFQVVNTRLGTAYDIEVTPSFDDASQNYTFITCADDDAQPQGVTCEINVGDDEG